MIEVKNTDRQLLCDPEDVEKLSAVRWKAVRKSRDITGENGGEKPWHLLGYRRVYFKNGDIFDVRKENLTTKNVNPTSKWKYVTYERISNQWRLQFKHKDPLYFKSEDEAIEYLKSVNKLEERKSAST